VINKFMMSALKEAQKAYAILEVPVGCVIVKDGKIIARGHNVRELEQSIVGHAELVAIKKASKKLGSWRLEDCDIYVTLEPCSMCSGAIIQSRIKNLYFGAFDPKTGACGSVLNLFEHNFNHKVNVTGGIMEEECSRIIKEFFRELRQKNIDNNQ
jgi:tRNA(adenine34) deaminase